MPTAKKNIKRDETGDLLSSYRRIEAVLQTLINEVQLAKGKIEGGVSTSANISQKPLMVVLKRNTLVTKKRVSHGKL